MRYNLNTIKISSMDLILRQKIQILMRKRRLKKLKMMMLKKMKIKTIE